VTAQHPAEPEFRVEQVLSWVTLPVRQQVLRPHQTLAELRQADDDGPQTANFAAYAGDEVIGTATVRAEDAPAAFQDRQGDPGWRLRGMATVDGWRGRGVGAAVLERVIAHVGELGGGLLWCNARLPAVAFYQRAGFATRGEPWEDKQIGPHILMSRQIASAR
jgi:GNAT superfamily N-acetyltransferase